MKNLFLTLVFMIGSAFGLAQKLMHVKIIDEQASVTDTMYLQVWDNVLGFQAPFRAFKAIAKDHEYDFYIPVSNRYVRVSIAKFNRISRFSEPFIDHYLAEQEDDIVVSTGRLTPLAQLGPSRSYSDSLMKEETLPDISFSGTGAAKYTLYHEVRQRSRYISDSVYPRGTVRPDRLSDSNDYRALQLINPVRLVRANQFAVLQYVEQRKILSNNRQKISPFVFEILQADIIGASLEFVTNPYSRFVIQLQKYSSSVFRDSLNKVMKKIYITAVDQLRNYKDSAALYSSFLLWSTVKQSVALNEFNKNLVLNFIDRVYKNSLKDKLLTEFLLQGNLSRLQQQGDAYNFAISAIKSDTLKNLLNATVKKQIIGSKPFDFLLPDKDGRIFSLKNFEHKTIFIDFWYTGCMACAEYYNEQVKYAEAYFRDSGNVVFITVSIDSDKEQWKASVNSGIYTSQSAINLYTNGFGQQHPVIAGYSVTSYPRPILIGPDGSVFSNQINDLRETTRHNKGGRLIQLIKAANKSKS